MATEEIVLLPDRQYTADSYGATTRVGGTTDFGVLADELDTTTYLTTSFGTASGNKGNYIRRWTACRLHRLEWGGARSPVVPRPRGSGRRGGGIGRGLVDEERDRRPRPRDALTLPRSPGPCGDALAQRPGKAGREPPATRVLAATV